MEETPKSTPNLPPHPPANVVNQVNTRDALTLNFMSSGTMVDGLGYDILNAEQVDGFKKVRLLFQFPALLPPNLFLYQSTQYYWGDPTKTCNRNQNPRRRTEPRPAERLFISLIINPLAHPREFRATLRPPSRYQGAK